MYLASELEKCMTPEILNYNSKLPHRAVLNSKKPYIAVRLFARGLDKEMGMSGTDAFASNWKVI